MKQYVSKFSGKELDERLTKVDNIPTKTSELNNDSGFISEADADNKYTDKNKTDVLEEGIKNIKNKIDDLENNLLKKETFEINVIDGYISRLHLPKKNTILHNLYENTKYNLYINIPFIKDDESIDGEFTWKITWDGEGNLEIKEIYQELLLPEHFEIYQYVENNEIPTKISQLENDKNYITNLDIQNKADLENGKIVASQIPDYLLGQVMFGGLIYINNSVIPTANFDAKYGPFSGQYVIIDIHKYYKYEGVYFIAQEDGIILDIDVKVGDWIVSTGCSWEKIDNTDAVSSVAGLVGNVNASSLAAALADLTDSNSLARKTDLPKKLSELENDIEIGGGGGGGITTETDPIFSASPAASITEAKKAEWDGKQEKITDLDAIRSGAEKGATALQSVPSEYVTETELNNKGYATTSALNNKVDKVSGKQLSTQDFTTELKSKLNGIEANAQKNVQSDWAENDPGSDTYVNNRTHYSYDIEQVTSFSITSKNQGDILVTGLYDGVFYRIINNAGGKHEAFHFVEGRKVVIPSNGPTIEAVCAYEDDYCLKLTTPTYGMTESFVLKEVYVEQLDDVYIPETIARKAEIATINGQSLTEGGDITIQGGAVADNVYHTDFTVEDLYALLNGDTDQLQIDAQGLTDAIYNHKNIIVPYSDAHMIGGEAILLGEVADTDIYFAVYTHQAHIFYCEAIEGVIYNWGIWGKDATSTVEQTEHGNLKNIAIANAVQTGSGNIYPFPGQANGDEDDVLLSRGTVKTINGQYLLADENSNDITVAYPVEMATSSSMALKPNTVTVWGGTVAGTISISFALPLQGYVSEYIARFTVAADGVQLIVPDRVVWADGVLPAMTPGKTYEISFLSTSWDNSIKATFLEF